MRGKNGKGKAYSYYGKSKELVFDGDYVEDERQKGIERSKNDVEEVRYDNIRIRTVVGKTIELDDDRIFEGEIKLQLVKTKDKDIAKVIKRLFFILFS